MRLRDFVSSPSKCKSFFLPAARQRPSHAQWHANYFPRAAASNFRSSDCERETVKISAMTWPRMHMKRPLSKSVESCVISEICHLLHPPNVKQYRSHWTEHQKKFCVLICHFVEKCSAKYLVGLDWSRPTLRVI